MGKYCKWYNDGLIEAKGIFKYKFISSCGHSKVVGRYSERCKQIYSNDDTLKCPTCGGIVTVGMLM